MLKNAKKMITQVTIIWARVCLNLFIVQIVSVSDQCKLYKGRVIKIDKLKSFNRQHLIIIAAVTNKD